MEKSWGCLPSVLCACLSMPQQPFSELQQETAASGPQGACVTQCNPTSPTKTTVVTFFHVQGLPGLNSHHQRCVHWAPEPFFGFVLTGVFTRVADSHSGLLLGGGVGSGDFALNRNYTKRKKPQLAPAPTLSQSKGKRTSSAGQEGNPPV